LELQELFQSRLFIQAREDDLGLADLGAGLKAGPLELIETLILNLSEVVLAPELSP